MLGNNTESMCEDIIQGGGWHGGEAGSAAASKLQTRLLDPELSMWNQWISYPCSHPLCLCGFPLSWYGVIW